MDGANNGNSDGNGVKPPVTQIAAAVHDNGHGLVPSFDHVQPSDDTGMSRMSHAMYNYE